MGLRSWLGSKKTTITRNISQPATIALIKEMIITPDFLTSDSMFNSVKFVFEEVSQKEVEKEIRNWLNKREEWRQANNQQQD